MKLYTRTGDDGSTGLFGGGRVPKDDLRVEAYGTVDELNACVGVAINACAGSDAVLGRIRDILTSVQSRLFDLGADLATPAGGAHEDKVPRLTDAHVREVETWIDEIDEGNAPMQSFVLPGGSEPAARLHLARTVCRRAERRMVTLAASEPINPHGLVYVNRLGDMLFAMARRANAAAGVADVPWKADAGKRKADQ